MYTFTPKQSDTGHRCYACDKPLKNPTTVLTSDNQQVWVGPECWKRIKEAGKSGYQPLIGRATSVCNAMNKPYCQKPRESSTPA